MTSTNRRRFLQTSAAAPLAATTQIRATTRPANAAKPHPNLLFILTDQWRGSALGCESDEVVRTPNLDGLARDGLLCSRAYAANPVCTPNRSCLLTGRYSHQTGMVTNNLMLPPDEVCWPQVLADSGYRTHYIGKWHVDGTEKPGYVPPGWRRRGFQSFEGFNRGHIYHKPWGYADDGSPLVPPDVAAAPDYYEPTFQTDLAMRFMKQQRNSGQPFACCLSLGPPHTPFRPPIDFDRYTPGEIRLRPNVPERHHRQARKDLAGYYGLCESLDHEVGRLLHFLNEQQLAQDTLVVFTSDHGELAGSHGKYRKGEPEEESLRVPLIMRLPGRIPAGTKSEALVNSIDLMPTLISLCGLKPPETCSGLDLADVVTGLPSAAPPKQIYTEGKVSSEGSKGRAGAWRCLVTQRHKLVVRGGEQSVAALYDLQEDPFELNNLADDPSSAELARDLTRRLLSIRDRTADTWPKPPRPALKMYAN